MYSGDKICIKYMVYHLYLNLWRKYIEEQSSDEKHCYCAAIKILSGIANSEDPDQTASSDLGLHCLHIQLSETLMFKTLGHLPYHIYLKYFDT